MASIDVGIHPDPAGITTMHFADGATGPFSMIELAVGQSRVAIYVHNRAVLASLQVALTRIRADMDQAEQTASDQTPTVMADWPAGPPGEALGVFGK